VEIDSHAVMTGQRHGRFHRLMLFLMGFALLYPSYVGVVVMFGFVGWVERSETHQIASLNLIHDFHHLPSQKAKYLVGRNDEMMNMASQQLFGHSHV
jgi:hypothetical protein